MKRSGLALIAILTTAGCGVSGEANECLTKSTEGQWNRAYNGCSHSVNVVICEKFLTGRESCRTKVAPPNGFIYQIGNDNSGFLVSAISPTNVTTFLCKADHDVVWTDNSKTKLGCQKN